MRKTDLKALSLWWIVSASAVLIGASIAGVLPGGVYSQAAALVIAVVPVALMIPRTNLLLACLAVVYLGDWLALDLRLLPGWTTWLVEALILLLVLRSARAWPSMDRVALMPALLVGFAVVLSGLWNLALGGGLLTTLVGIRTYLRFPLLGMAAWALRDAVKQKKAFAVFLAVAAMQVPVSLFQMIARGPGDSAPGTFGPGGTGIEAIFLCAIIGVLIGEVSTSTALKRWAGIAGAVLLFLPTVIGSAVASYLLAPLAGVGSVALSAKRPVQVVTGMILAVLLIIVGLPFAARMSQSLGYMDAARLLSSVDSVLEYDRQISRTGSLGRLDKIRVAAAMSAQSGELQGAFGYGPGSATASSLTDDASGRLLRDPVVRFLTPSLTRSLLEIGWLGVAAHVLALVWIAWHAGLSARSSAGVATRIAILAFAASLLVLVSAAYTDSWTQPGTAALVWTCWGLSDQRNLGSVGA